jgi:hypothetical protein
MNISNTPIARENIATSKTGNPEWEQLERSRAREVIAAIRKKFPDWID